MFGPEQESTNEQSDEQVSDPKHEQNVVSNQVVPDEIVQVAANDLEGAQSLAAQQVDRGNELQMKQWSEQMEEEPFKYPAPRFEEYSKIVKPIFSLEKINRVTGQAINLVLTTVTNAAEMARAKNYSIQHDQELIIMTIQSNSDITSQQLWRLFRRHRELSLDLLIEFLSDRVQNIDPAECMMIQVQPIPINQAAQGASSSGAIPRTVTPIFQAKRRGRW